MNIPPLKSSHTKCHSESSQKKKNQKRKIIPAPGLQAQRHMVRHAAFLIRDLFSPFTVNRSAPWHPGFLGHCSRSSVSVPKHGAQEDGGQGAVLYFFFFQVQTIAATHRV